VPVPDRDLARQRQVVDAFFTAARGGDLDALVAVLDPDVVLRIDAGETGPAGSKKIRGARAVATQALSGLTSLLPAVSVRPALVNGAAGVIILRRGRPVTVIGFTVAAGQIAEIDSIAGPARLRRITAGLAS
jgi:RNA polymerase sigma-70 factor (ECF subfamily)